MKRIDTGRAANAYGGPAGGTGHWQDTDPTGGTQFDAEWCEGVQEALCGAIEGLGGVLAGDETGQLWDVLSPRVDGILSDAADTGVDTTTHKRVLIASSNSQASGVHTAVIASDGTSATTLDAAAVACQDSTVRREAVLLASRNAQLYDAKRIGWGYNTGAAIVPGAVNQNLTGIIDTETGALHIAGGLKIGGDPDDGSGSTCSIAETTGTIQTSGAVDASLTVHADGLLTSDTGLALTAGSINLPTGAAGTSGQLVNPGTITPSTSITPTVYTSAISAGSLVFPVIVSFTGGDPRISACVINAGASFTLTIMNKDAAVDCTAITVNWMIINL